MILRVATVGGAADGHEALLALLDARRCEPEDLCRPREFTMVDPAVGYLESDRAVAFANMGRITAHHAVVATRIEGSSGVSNPLRLRGRDVAGLFALAARWFATVHALHPTEARCPSFGFDTLYTGGVSSHGP